LSDVRRGMQRYLEATCISCFRNGEGGLAYKYEYPEDFENEVD